MATEVNMTGKAIMNPLTDVRDRPTLFSNIIGAVPFNTSVNITQIEGDWYYITASVLLITVSGWARANTIKLDQNKTVNISKEELERRAQEAEEKARKQSQSVYDQQMTTIEENLSTTQTTDTHIVDSLIIHNLNGVYGIPYQFMESVDPRLITSDESETVMGRKYSEKIISKMPLLCITPGKTKFMSNYSKEEKNGLLATLINLKNGLETDISDIIEKNGKYFTFEFAYSDYFEYVNSLCRVGARFLNIEDVELNIGGTIAKASAFDWQKALNSDLKATLTSQEFIGFYMDSTDSVSESFSNGTTPSQLESTINGFSETAKEIGFLLGAGAGIDYKVADDAALSGIMESIDNISQKYIQGGILKDIASNFSTVSVGGKLLFPEIWSDSEFSRDFSINIKLRTPDADTLSWYLNIYVPLCHLIALAAGHQTDNPNGYYSPFLVRAFYKGLFNVDMGIVTNMNIKKGNEAAWNIDGLPTEVDIDLTIKDLYNMLAIVPNNEPKTFVTNSILMDYIANTCGININQMDIQRSLEIYYILVSTKVVQLPNRIVRQFQEAIDNYAFNLYDKAINKFLI